MRRVLGQSSCMTIYENAPISLTYQNFGTAWLGIMRGNPEFINDTFNGLFNLMATNGKLEKHDVDGALCTFWTSPKAMQRFFFNQYTHPRQQSATLHKEGKAFAAQRIAELMPRQEFFIRYDGVYLPAAHNIGTSCAERPDYDFKDSVLIHAHADKTVDKTATSD